MSDVGGERRDRASVVESLVERRHRTAVGFGRQGRLRPRRDPNGLFAQVDPAVEVHPLTGAMLEGVSYRGHEGMRQWFEDVAEYWESMWVEAYQFLDAEQAVVVVGRVHGRGKRSGVAIEAPAAWVFHLRDARLTYLRLYLGPPQGPRSRRAVGVGDVGGERRAHTLEGTLRGSRKRWLPPGIPGYI